MTSGRTSNGQKIVVMLSPPPNYIKDSIIYTNVSAVYIFTAVLCSVLLEVNDKIFMTRCNVQCNCGRIQCRCQIWRWSSWTFQWVTYFFELTVSYIFHASEIGRLNFESILPELTKNLLLTVTSSLIMFICWESMTPPHTYQLSSACHRSCEL